MSNVLVKMKFLELKQLNEHQKAKGQTPYYLAKEVVKQYQGPTLLKT